MWTYTIAPLLLMLAIFAFLLAVPVSLGVLLRLLIRKTQPNLVAYFGAALGFAAQHGAAGHSPMMRSMTDVFPFAVDSLMATLSLGAIGVLIPLAMWLVFVRCGVKLVDRQEKEESARLWLVVNPIIAVTVYGGIVFGLMNLCVGMLIQGRVSYPFALLYRFFLWELLFILCVAFAITAIYLNRRKRHAPSNQNQKTDASAPNSDL
jgi:uncharacterized membrane protein